MLFLGQVLTPKICKFNLKTSLGQRPGDFKA